ncbi:MAG: hypothetical protein JW836_11220 [Deltaproteobacteria bacterium]|nr:hypothetical protein [Deltaproteobacteria bacterium]
MQKEWNQLTQAEKNQIRDLNYERIKEMYAKDPESVPVEARALLVLFAIDRMIDLNEKRNEIVAELWRRVEEANKLTEEFIAKPDKVDQDHYDYDTAFQKLLPYQTPDLALYQLDELFLSVEIEKAWHQFLQVVPTEKQKNRTVSEEDLRKSMKELEEKGVFLDPKIVFHK